MRSHDVIIIGAGVIGVSLALELRRAGLHVLVVDRSEPGREASHAAAGMLVAVEEEHPVAMRPLVRASAQLYPEFVASIQADAAHKIDFQRNGAIHIFSEDEPPPAKPLSPAKLRELEPNLVPPSTPAAFFEEDYIDPRSLMTALVEAARHRGVDVATGTEALEVTLDNGKVSGLRTERTTYPCSAVVNCAGAWAAQLKGCEAPTRPVKGHMLALLPETAPAIRRVVRATENDVYILPRASGMVVLGSTVEDSGFDKRVNPDTILRLHHLVAGLVPALKAARIHESWTGLRPS